ncbi:hypothetical protein HPB52_024631 [Rhipicephalus sanguineus]|uniref:Uncharacterized protein n=1 Tax=Rhipicephalus sanguineus TaxID=34632 RepID=A0A9D4YRV2_RHISA|nr:hypothetical protein HPB52_024631 [Rhipicephalus sanguineus]
MSAGGYERKEKVEKGGCIHERNLQLNSEDRSGLVSRSGDDAIHHEIRRREKQKAQRPLTRYLPVRGAECDLRQHVVCGSPGGAVPTRAAHIIILPWLPAQAGWQVALVEEALVRL